MKKVILAAAVAAFLALPLAAQTESNQQPSLGEAARKLRQQKKPPAKPATVITNDNLGTSPSAAPPEAAPSEGKTSEAAPSKPGVQAEEKETPEKKHAKEEAQWRKRFADARTKLEQAQKELDVLQRELNLLQEQYYTDPNKALQQQYSRKEIDDQRQKIADKQKEVDQLRQALSDLEDELRRSGGDSGWARE